MLYPHCALAGGCSQLPPAGAKVGEQFVMLHGKMTYPKPDPTLLTFQDTTGKSKQRELQKSKTSLFKHASVYTPCVGCSYGSD